MSREKYILSKLLECLEEKNQYYRKELDNLYKQYNKEFEIPPYEGQENMFNNILWSKVLFTSLFTESDNIQKEIIKLGKEYDNEHI